MAAAGRPVAAHERLAVAVSGGPDSIGLLAAAHEAFPSRLVALTVDHGMRMASASEAASVSAQCKARGIVHQTLCWDGEKPTSNVQSVARVARYRLMLDWCRAEAIPLLLTAHHLEDQAETLLMRLVRGSGSAGLAGTRALRHEPGVDIVRPLLGTRRAVLAGWAAGWDIVNDPSNTDPRYSRTGMRALLRREAGHLPAAGLAASAAHLAADEEALAWAAAQAWAGRVRVADGVVWLDAKDLPDALRRRLVIAALKEICPQIAPRGKTVMRLIARLDSGRAATIGSVKVQPFEGLRAAWKFTQAPLRQGFEQNPGAK